MKIVTALLAFLLAGCAGEQTGSPSSSRTTTPTTTSSTVSGPKMPAVVQMRLTDARELLRAQGYRVTEEDGSGQARQILEPLNWVVVAQLPEADVVAPAGTEVVLKVRKPTDTSGTSGTPQPAKGTVPNVVCLDLQTAQDTLQAAGFFVLWSEDATGQGRQQLVDRNWVVVSQSEAAGSTPDAKTKITLGAVKFGEPTGGSGCKS